MTYSQKANPNATNSEMDSKRIITHKELTSPQKDELIDQYVDIVVDNMSEESLILYAQEQLKSCRFTCHIKKNQLLLKMFQILKIFET